MQKKFILIILLLFFFSLSLEAFIQKRQHWWGKKYSDYKIEINSPEIKENPIILNLLKQEIKTAKEILKIFNPSSFQEKRIFKKEKIIKKLKSFYNPAFSILLLHYGLNRLNSFKLNDEAKNIIQNEFTNLYIKNFPDISKQEITHKYKKFFSPNDYKYIKLEILLGSLINNYEKQKTFLFNNLLKKFEKTDLFNKKRSENELNSKISKIVRDELFRTDFNKLFIIDKNSLTKSWVWKNNLININHELDLLLKIKKLLKPFNKKYSYNEIKFYFNNPFKLENKVFKRYYHNYNFHEKNIKFNNPNLPVQINIPKTPELSSLLNKINRLRKNTIKTITGYEDLSERKNIFEKFYKIKRQSYRLSNSLFKIEEEKLKNYLDSKKKLKEKEQEKIEKQLYTDYDPFFEAKKIHKKQKINTTLYIKKNIRFIKWILNKKRPDFCNLDLVSSNMLKRNKQYIQFIILLEDQAAEGYLIKDKIFKAKYLTLINHEKHLLKALKYSSSHYEILLVQPGLNMKKREKLKDDIKKFHEYVINSQKEIINLKKQYCQNLKKLDKRNRLFLKSHKSEIAQTELDTILKNIFLYYNALQKLNYNKTIFEDYLLIYNKLYKQTTQGILSEKLKDVITKKSILSLIKNYNAAIFKKNYTTKTYLKNEILSKLANFYTLFNLYKRKGFLLSFPEMKKLTAIKKELKKAPQIKISAWTMNEKNYKSVDKKAVLLLSKIRYKKIWDKHLKKGNFNNKPDKKYTFNKLNISLYIPDGWEKKIPLKIEKQRGILSKFFNEETGSRIIIAKIPFKSSKEETTDLWLKKIGQHTLKVGWGEKEKDTYYWNISKNGKKRIMKTFAFKKKNNLIIISGESMKFYYPYFENRINTVFKSIQ